jgi:hypothetical protein
MTSISVFTFNFTTVPYSYIYLMARDDGVAALFTAKTVFDNGAETVITGVSSSTWFDWEVNTIYKTQDAFSVLPGAVLNWGGDWQAPAVGNLANSIAGVILCMATSRTASGLFGRRLVVEPR